MPVFYLVICPYRYNLEDVVVDQVLIAKYGVYDLALDKLGKNVQINLIMVTYSLLI